MYEQIKERYDKGYITDDQLDRYVALGVITDEQAEQIKSGNTPAPEPGGDTIATADLDAAYKEGVNSYEYTDTMGYQTGTTQASRTEYGLGTQYRNIEGVLDNAYDFTDGVYYKSNTMYVLNNPSEYSNMSGGTSVGTVSDGYPNAFSITEAYNGQWLCPTSSGGSVDTYTTDYWITTDREANLITGGKYSKTQNIGMFFVSYLTTESSGDPNTGCRLMKLPNGGAA